MVMVEARADRVERDLVQGGLACPACGGELRPWAHARQRTLRDRGRLVRLRPRRARCRSCGATHVLVPVICLPRRVDLARVIGEALRAKAQGSGHRPIAERLGVPPSTVRGWLRRFAARAETIRAHFTALAHRLDPSLGEIAPRASPFADAVEAIGVAARAVASRFGRAPVWAFAAAATSGLLLANTSSPFPAPW
jgi:transposase-like protein